MMRRWQDEPRWPKELTTALLAGFLGTAAMTIAMAAMHRRFPPAQREPLPPRQISMAAAERVGIKDGMDEEARFGTTMALHFSYGTAVGALYTPLADAVPGHYPLKGMAFGVLVWVVSYLGWLPLSGLLSSATRHPAPRNAVMIVAHLVWGTVIATIVETVDRGKGKGKGNDTDSSHSDGGHRAVLAQ